ncbi:MAG: hypothetical protein HYZ37_14540 [Candidatus Solibacter usitatus]|nr:hypothetical protein [Candidatus Solibacter usitatus]
MFVQPVWNFEQEPMPPDADETEVNLRAYLDRMTDEKMSKYRAEWTDEEVIAWDGNFRDDGNLMLICSERDIDVGAYRVALEECIRYRDRVRGVMEQPTGR